MMGPTELVGFGVLSAKSFDGAENPSTTDAVPTMTGSTTPSGTASASSTYSSTYPAWRAFDDTDGGAPDYTCWAAAAATGWLRYDFPAATVINKYTLLCQATQPANAPRDWTFEGWNGTAWVVLRTETNITGWASGVRRTFTCVNGTAYTGYRLNVTANNGGSVVSIGELELITAT